MKIIVPNTIRTYEDIITSSTLTNDWSFPVWNSNYLYYQGNMVYYSGKLYRVLEFNTGKQPDTYASDFWYEWGIWNNTTEPTWNIGTAYSGGELVTFRDGYRKYIFKALTASTGITPTSDPEKWQNIGAINLYRCLYGATENKTEVDGNQTITLEAYKADYIYMIGLDGSNASIVVKDSGGTTLKTETASLTYKNATSWADYFFKDFSTRTTFGTEVYMGFNHQVDVTVESAAVSRIGNIVIGRSFYIGSALWGADVGILDYSLTERDGDFGDVTLKQGSYANRADVTVVCDTNRADAVKQFLTAIRGQEVLILGDDRDNEERFDSLVIRGFLRDWNITLENPTMSEINIDIEGLI